MKRFLLCMLASFMLALAPLTYSGCSTAPTERVTAVNTLKAVGHAAEAAVALSAQLYANKVITDEQSRQVLDFYNTRFQPAFRAAVIAAQSDLSRPSESVLTAMASELANLVATFQKPTP